MSVKFLTDKDEKKYVKTVNNIPADENGNVDIETNGSSANAVLYTPQTPTMEEQSQARENIAATCEYYSTTREELGVAPEAVDSSYIWGLYDALMAKYPDCVQKNEIHNDGGTFTNYEYVISTGEYNTEGAYTERYGDKGIKKPKYLILSGIHGLREKPAIISLYRFVRDVLDGHNIPAQFREGCVLHIVPVGNPYGVDHNITENENDVNINRNFYTTTWEHGENVSDGKKPGAYPASEKETQAIVNWLGANQDAEMFFDCHNNGAVVNEIVWFVGLDTRLKEMALQGVGRVVPLWRDVIRYADGTVYPISVTIPEGGLAIYYASDVLNIPSLAFEMSAFQNGSQEEFNAYDVAITPETVSAGAEIIGNVLIEFYEQIFSGEVVDMTETNEKIDALAVSMDALLSQVNSGFCVETGVYTVEEDVTGMGAVVELPCKGVKIMVFVSDANTRTEILKTASGIWMVGFVGQTLAELPYVVETYVQCAGYVSRMNSGKLENAAGVIVDTDDGVKFATEGLKAGTYNWTAYYWNE